MSEFLRYFKVGVLILGACTAWVGCGRGSSAPSTGPGGQQPSPAEPPGTRGRAPISEGLSGCLKGTMGFGGECPKSLERFSLEFARIAERCGVQDQETILSIAEQVERTCGSKGL